MFKDICKSLRKERGITQIALAEAINVSPGNVGDWENGKSQPSYKALKALCTYFRVDANTLLDLPISNTDLSTKEKQLLNLTKTLDQNEMIELIENAKIKSKKVSGSHD